MVVGLLQLELHIPAARSLKDKRSVVKSLKDQLRGRFNIAVAEVDPNQLWQRVTVGVSTVGDDRAAVTQLLRHVTDWIRLTRLVELVRVEEDYVAD
jgi:hypothetical protein